MDSFFRDETLDCVDLYHSTLAIGVPKAKRSTSRGLSITFLSGWKKFSCYDGKILPPVEEIEGNNIPPEWNIDVFCSTFHANARQKACISQQSTNFIIALKFGACIAIT